MKLTRLAAGPDWKKYLGLGEELLNQPHAAAQCQLIAETLQASLGCEAQVWLAEPFYPLPGEPDFPTLPGAPAPELVRQVLSTHLPACLAADGTLPAPARPPQLPTSWPFPSRPRASCWASSRQRAQPAPPSVPKN